MSEIGLKALRHHVHNGHDNFFGQPDRLALCLKADADAVDNGMAMDAPKWGIPYVVVRRSGTRWYVGVRILDKSRRRGSRLICYKFGPTAAAAWARGQAIVDDFVEDPTRINYRYWHRGTYPECVARGCSIHPWVL